VIFNLKLTLFDDVLLGGVFCYRVRHFQGLELPQIGVGAGRGKGGLLTPTRHFLLVGSQQQHDGSSFTRVGGLKRLPFHIDGASRTIIDGD